MTNIKFYFVISNLHLSEVVVSEIVLRVVLMVNVVIPEVVLEVVHFIPYAWMIPTFSILELIPMNIITWPH